MGKEKHTWVDQLCLVAIAEGAQLVGGLRCFDWSDDGIYQSGVCIFDPRGSHDHASIRITGCDA